MKEPGSVRRRGLGLGTGTVHKLKREIVAS